MRQCAGAFSGEKPRILQRRDLSPILGGRPAAFLEHEATCCRKRSWPVQAIDL